MLKLCETCKKESKGTIEKMIKAAKHSHSSLSLAELRTHSTEQRRRRSQRTTRCPGCWPGRAGMVAWCRLLAMPGEDGSVVSSAGQTGRGW